MRALLLAVATLFATVDARTVRQPRQTQTIDAQIVKLEEAVQVREVAIAALKRDAASLQFQADQVEELGSPLFHSVGTGAPGATEIRMRLAAELKKLGASPTPRALSALANAMGEGGHNGMMTAMIVLLAEASAEARAGQRSQNTVMISLDQAVISCHESKPGVLAAPPNGCSAILSGLTARPDAVHLGMPLALTAASMSPTTGGALFVKGVSAQATAQVTAIDQTITDKKQEIKELEAEKASLQKKAPVALHH